MDNETTVVYGHTVVKASWIILRNQMSLIHSMEYLPQKVVYEPFIIIFDDITQKYATDGWKHFEAVAQRLGFKVKDERDKHRVRFIRLDW